MSIENQNNVIEAPLADMSVVAGAGSGKTRTAIARVLSMLGQLPVRSKVVLLSFSNVAVNTFRRGLGQQNVDVERVTVSTFDSFFLQYVLGPYASRVMRCVDRPFLVLGEEPFLAGFRLVHGGRPFEITELKVRWEGNQFHAYLGAHAVPWQQAQQAIERLGTVGAYTYDIGRYWVQRTLRELPYLVDLLVRRYPQVIVDEAQDVGSMDWQILCLLRQRGANLTLIGDPAQAIFGFNGGNGQYLQAYIDAQGIRHYSLGTNFRSVPGIVNCANLLTGRNDAAARAPVPTHSGAFLVGYDPANPRLVLDQFLGVVNPLGYTNEQVAIICRANSLVGQVRGGAASRGVGLVKKFIKAVDHRLANEYHLAFRECVGIVGALLDPPLPRFRIIIEEADTVGAKQVQAKIWRFVCDHQNGLPDSRLDARAQWLPALVQNVRALIESLSAHSLTFGAYAQRITIRDLEAGPVVLPRPTVRVDTVHQVKGESIDAVLYIATEAHATGMFGGAGTENGRIGYVALTRAKDLFWLAVPNDALVRLAPRAAGLGILRLPAN